MEPNANTQTQTNTTTAPKKQPTVTTPPQGQGTAVSAAAPAAEPQAKQDPAQTLRAFFESQRHKFAEVLPKHLTADRLLKVALLASSRDPKLAECTPLSLLKATMEAAVVGLEPNTPLQHAWLIPYKNGKTNKYEAQFQIGYRGLVDIVRRSGEVRSVEAHCVYAEDLFECELGLDRRLRHVPNFDADDRGPLRLVYAVAHLKDGATQLEIMTRGQIEDLKKRSKSASKDDSPWKTAYDEMARKTVVKRLCKMLPVSIEVARAIEADDTDTIDVDHTNHTEVVNQLVAGRAAAVPTTTKLSPLLGTEPDFPVDDDQGGDEGEGEE